MFRGHGARSTVPGTKKMHACSAFSGLLIFVLRPKRICNSLHIESIHISFLLKVFLAYGDCLSRKTTHGEMFFSVARKDEDPTDPEVVGVGGPWKLDGLHIGLPAGCYCDAW